MLQHQETTHTASEVASDDSGAWQPRKDSKMKRVLATDVSGVVGGFVAFIIYAPASIILMMWWGYGGYKAVTPPWLHSVGFQVPIYLVVQVACIHGFLYFAARATRHGALIGVVSPWLLVFVVGTGATGPLMIVPFLVVFAHLAFEGARSERTEDPS